MLVGVIKKANECKFFSHLISLKVETTVYREDNGV